MAGVIDDSHVGIAALLPNSRSALRISPTFRFSLELDGIEAGRLEHRGNGRRIVRGIAELGHVPVGRIADHQRHALLGKRGLAGQQSQPGRQDHPQKRAHQKFPNRQ